MNILLSMTVPFPEKIFSSEKPFEFRNILPKNFSTKDTAFIYESKTNGGRGKVVGSFTTKGILDINLKGFVEQNFIVYFCKNILKDDGIASKFEKALSIDLPNYKSGTILDFALDDEAMDFIEKYHERPSLMNLGASEILDKSKIWDNARDILHKCDDWLVRIGFLNDFCETNYRHAFIIDAIEEFSKPIDIDCFIGIDGQPLKRAPQGWQYVI